MNLSDSLAANQEPSFVATPVARWSAVDQVIAQLREGIASGALPVGSKLPSETKLAASLGVSRPVIREALGSLRTLGLVASSVGKGWQVTSDTVSSNLVLADSYLPEHLYEVRQHLEVPSAGYAALHRTDSDVERLRQILEDEGGAADPTSAVALDGAFHIGIARCSGNPLLERLVEYIRTGLEEQSRALTTLHGRGQQAMAEHQAILDAISAGDRQAAEAAMQAHLDAVMRSVASLGTVTGDGRRAGDGLVGDGPAGGSAAGATASGLEPRS
ncbi:FadR family transcriptional regulator [Actinomadura graeca]|uniref:FadR family transcriptional regulator n=1 Tax=Actinomadura graeca TaxID=2750812 RepID=A0ABX8QV87_9ACTN|nr:FadR/GntR family transcriptional regulator [Actinomadura graeca]QXJ21357.1 FadR family transcriptional regulator [Actinomadura graeca]